MGWLVEHVIALRPAMGDAGWQAVQGVLVSAGNRSEYVLQHVQVHVIHT